MKAKKRSRGSTEPNGKDEFTGADLRTRLDGIVLLLAGIRFGDENGTVRLGPVAKLLHRAGYKPTEIAKLFGKKKATDVSQYLY